MIFFTLAFTLAFTLIGALTFHVAIASELLLQHSSRPLQAESAIEALIPWETPISGFFVRSHFGPPADLKNWELRIDGLVEKPLIFTLNDLKALPIKRLHAVLECSGNGRGLQTLPAPGIQWQNGAVGNAEWTGVSLQVLLNKAGIKPEARFGTLEGADSPPLPNVPRFIRSVPLSKLLQADTLVAFKMNRENIPILHGGPVRLVLPHWYGENWTKWLTRISLTENEDPHFYMKKGYRIPSAPIKPGQSWDAATGIPIEEIRVQSFLVSPLDGAVLDTDQIQIRGKAFSGAGPITRVEISTDQGKTWTVAELEPPRSLAAWQEFHSTLMLKGKEKWTILSRATDAKGNQQPLEHEWNPGGYVRNAVHSIQIQTQVPHTPLVTQKCLTCHAVELITSQRLTPLQWEGTLKKMEAFGVKLEASERQILLEELAAYSPSVPLAFPKPVSLKAISVAKGKSKITPHLQGSKAQGQKQFERYCMACHGKEGVGLVGPNLRGRTIPGFSTIVQQGRTTMPAFGSILTPQDITDIESYLQK